MVVSRLRSMKAQKAASFDLRFCKLGGIIYLPELTGAAGIRMSLGHAWFLSLPSTASYFSAWLLLEHFLNTSLALEFLVHILLLRESNANPNDLFQ